MCDSTVFVGLDYHQKSVQVCVMNGAGRVLSNRRCENDVAALLKQVQPFGSRVFAAVESCTGAADLAESLINQGRWSVDLAHPGFVARMKQTPDKHDWGDAKVIADLERVGYLPKVWLAPHAVRELRRLVRYRQQLVDQRRNIRLRVNALLRDQRQLRPPAGAWSKRWLQWLRSETQLSEEGRWIVERWIEQMHGVKQEIHIIEARLTERTADDPIVTKLMQYKGVGPVTAWTLRAEIGRFDRFRTGKQLARFCGLTPRNASSGEKQADAGLIKAGNRQLRAILIEAAHRMIRFDASWNGFVRRLEQRGKHKCVIVAALANRWIRRLFHSMQPSQLDEKRESTVIASATSRSVALAS